MSERSSSTRGGESGRVRVLLLGDAMVDAYLAVEPAGISDEAPVVVADCLGTSREFGGMLNTATALHALGAQVHLLARIGLDDEDGRWVRAQAEVLGMEADWLADESTITTQKMRVVAQGTGDYLARLDHEIVAPLSGALEQRLHERVCALIPEVDVVVVSDYAKGFVSQETAGLIVQTADRAGVPVVVDGKPCTIPWYAGATLFTPNVTEARKLALKLGTRDIGKSSSADVESVVSQIGPGLAEALQGSVLITCGTDGMYLYPGGQHIAADPPVDASEVGTTSGAGDIVTAVLACELAAGGSGGTDVMVQGARRAAALVSEAVRRPGGTCRLEG